MGLKFNPYGPQSPICTKDGFDLKCKRKVGYRHTKWNEKVV